MTSAVRISPRLPHQLVQTVDALVAAGLYIDRSDLVRDALRRFLGRQP